MTNTAPYDISQAADVAYIRLAGESGVIGTAVTEQGQWSVTAHDGVELGQAYTRDRAAEMLVADWQQRFASAYTRQNPTPADVVDAFCDAMEEVHWSTSTDDVEAARTATIARFHHD